MAEAVPESAGSADPAYRHRDDAGIAQIAPPAPIEERERSVLAELARDADARVSFQGLRRQLGVHQQVLARTLRRLEAAGLVAHEPHGYQLTDAGSRALRDAIRPAAPASHRVTLVHALLPPHVGGGEVAAQLARRWFGGLRWYGQSVGPGETALHWIVEPQRHRVTVRVTDGSVSLEVDAPASDAPRVYAAARPVLAAIAEVYGLAEEGASRVPTAWQGLRGLAA